MEVLSFRIESLADPNTLGTRSICGAERADDVLEDEHFKEVDLSDMVYFKRITRRPPLKINVPTDKERVIESSQSAIDILSLSGKFTSALPHGQEPAAAHHHLAPPTTTENPQVEIFKSFRVSMDDPTHKVLPAALKKYNITGPWQDYALYIVCGDHERFLGLEEKPLVLFKQLDKEGKKPMFLLRKQASIVNRINPTDLPEKTISSPTVEEAMPTAYRLGGLYYDRLSHEFAGRAEWACHTCGEIGMTYLMDICPDCIHTRCNLCPLRWATGGQLKGASKPLQGDGSHPVLKVIEFFTQETRSAHQRNRGSQFH